jgi:hypothetical protein
MWGNVKHAVYRNLHNLEMLQQIRIWECKPEIIDVFVNCNWVDIRCSSTVDIYTQTIHRTTQLIWEECGPCPIFASYTLAFALQLRKKHGKTSVRVAEEFQLARWKQNIQNRTYITIRIHKHNNKNT